MPDLHGLSENLTASPRGCIIIATGMANIPVPIDSIIWDFDDDPDGERPTHCRAWHQQSRSRRGHLECEVLQLKSFFPDGLWYLGARAQARRLMIVYEEAERDIVYPVTAYEVPRRQRR